jgi:PAS domain S-box-containing protein
MDCLGAPAQPSEWPADAADLGRLAANIAATEPAEGREEIYRSLFEDAPVAYHEIDRHGTLTRINRAECALLGYAPAEMLGRPVWELVDPAECEASRANVQRKMRAETALVPFERTYRRQDGALIATEVHETHIRTDDGEVLGIRTCLLDVTERKRADAALRRQTAELARSNAELEQFAYVASHDLQEPLRKIQAFGDRLKARFGDALADDGRDYLERMQNAASRMQTLINDLLTLSRVATKVRPFGAVDLAEVVRVVCSDLESRIQQLGGEVIVESLPVISGDRVQLSQLFQNLIGNALKFHRPGVAPCVTVKGSLVRASTGGTDECRITVEDNGIGFDEKYSERIFQIFQRLHGRSEYDGTGIGLAICRKIVERHAGIITAKSTPGSGSTFVVTMPLSGEER